VLLHRMRSLLLGLPVPESLSIWEPGPLAADARLWRRGLTLQHPQEGEEVSFGERSARCSALVFSAKRSTHCSAFVALLQVHVRKS